MAQPLRAADRYEFGPFVVDAARRVLWRNGRPVPITAKTFDLLLALIDRRGRIVGKEELLGRIWPDTTVQENNLVRQMSTLRRVLGQRPDQHDYIVTIPGQGYEFVAHVRDVSTVQDDGPTGGMSGGAARQIEILPFEAAGGVLPAGGVPAARGRVPAWLMGSAAGILVALAGVFILSRPSNQSTSESPRALQRITYDDASLPREPAWAPVGDRIAYTSDRAGNADIWTQRIGDPSPVRLTTSEANETEPDWSPDGGRLVFRSEQDGGGLYVIAAGGSGLRQIATFGYEPRWSPDGMRVLFKKANVLRGSPQLYTVGLDGSPPRRLREDLLADFVALRAAWHPDGRVSVWGTTREAPRRFVTVPIDTGPAVESTFADQIDEALRDVSPGRFVWARSRDHIYFEARTGETRNLWRVRVDPRTLRWISGPERLTTGAGEDERPALSPDGGRLLFTTRFSRTRLWAFPFDSVSGQLSGAPQPLTSGSGGEVDVDSAPSGSKLAYRAARAGRSELWERSVFDGTERLLLSSDQWRYTKPRWSPDGVWLAYSRLDKNSRSLGAVARFGTDGRGEQVLTRPGDVDLVPWAWSPDGMAILGACRFSTADRFSACLLPIGDGATVAGKAAVRVIASDPKRDLFCQGFSPDQRWISFLAIDPNDVTTSTLYVTAARGSPWTAMSDGTSFEDKPRWAADGRTLYFVSNRSGLPNVWGRRFDPDSGGPIGDAFRVTAFNGPQFMLTPRTAEMDIALTGRQLLLPMTESRGEIWMLDRVNR